ncbi:hypothetical protein DL767_002499 [Monosporascus sp. MG133]|nr:hypothetical protein DL767_002499 [Monosporascus sp. MG133]
MACITAEPGHRGYVLPGTCNTNWDYDANVELAVLFGVGFALRVVGALDPQNRALAAAARTPNLLAPIWVGVVHRVLFGRIVKAVVMAGVACQHAYVLVFAAFVARFHYVTVRLKRQKYPLPMFRPWVTTLATLYLSLALLRARNVFRVAQLAGGRENRGNPLVSRERYFYVRPGGAAAFFAMKQRTCYIERWRSIALRCVAGSCYGAVMNLLHPGRATLAGPERRWHHLLESPAPAEAGTSK